MRETPGEPPPDEQLPEESPQPPYDAADEPGSDEEYPPESMEEELHAMSGNGEDL